MASYPPPFHCTGKRKALLIAIKYAGTRHQLDGASSDLNRMFFFLCKKQGFTTAKMRVLTDFPPDVEGVETGDATRGSIVEGFEWLMAAASAGDSLFLYYSGHGKQVADTNGDEADGMDEAILTADKEIILDDDLKRMLPCRVPVGARLTAVFDACHSGTILDLPYVHDSCLPPTGIQLRDVVSSGAGIARSLLRRRPRTALRAAISLVERFVGVTILRLRKTDIGADVGQTVQFGVGRDDQEAHQHQPSAHTVVGAFTQAYIKAHIDGYQPNTYGRLLVVLRDKLCEMGYGATQTPQFSTSHAFDMATQVAM